MTKSVIALFTGLPGALEITNAFPGLEFTDGERAAIRGVRIMAGLVRLVQTCAVFYGIDQYITGDGLPGLIIGLIIAWCIGFAKPKLPWQVSEKIRDYAEYLDKKENE